VLLAVLLIAILDHSQGPIECVRHDMRGRATQAQTERVIRAGVRLPRRSEGRSASRGTDDSRSDGPRVSGSIRTCSLGTAESAARESSRRSG
jgi:hypothetical protein